MTRGVCGGQRVDGGEFREWLLDEDGDRGNAGANWRRGLTPEMAAAVSKMMRDQDLILAGGEVSGGDAISEHAGIAGATVDAAAAESSDGRCARDCRESFWTGCCTDAGMR